MASAEQLLNEAQYAFNSISAGESRGNNRNRSRAKSLCKKIIRKYPVSTEAAEAHAILKRLGEEAFLSRMPIVHQHREHSDTHRTPEPSRQQAPTGKVAHRDDAVALDWSGLMSVFLATPKVVLGVIAFVGFVLLGILGPFMFLPLLVLVVLAPPVRALMEPRHRKEINAFVIRANAWIDKKYESGSGLA
jgi:hypothetical protein